MWSLFCVHLGLSCPFWLSTIWVHMVRTIWAFGKKHSVGREMFGMSFMFVWWCIFTSHCCRVCWIGWFLKCIFFHPSTNDLFSGSIKPSNYIINMPIFNKCTQLKENGKRTLKKNTTKCAGVTAGIIHGLICVCTMLFSVCSKYARIDRVNKRGTLYSV